MSFLLRCWTVFYSVDTMEVEDPITAKFLTHIESLMAKTTSEIVKVFADVLLEMRVEVSHSWREIQELKLEENEEQSAETEAVVNIKSESEELLVSDVSYRQNLNYYLTQSS